MLQKKFLCLCILFQGVIEVWGESMASVQAVQSDSLHVSDQQCRARGRSRSIGPQQLLDLCQSPSP